MPRNKPYSGAALLTMLIAIIGTVIMVTACRPPSTPVSPAVDVTPVAPCEHEYGPAPEGQPCVWDGGPEVNGSARWVLYAETCPVRTVQVSRLVDCIPRGRWGE